MKPLLRIKSYVLTNINVIHKHAFGVTETSIVCFWNYAQQLTHQRIDADTVKWLSQEILLKVWSKGSKDHFHIHFLITESMISFVDIQNDPLHKQKFKKKLEQKTENNSFHSVSFVCLWYLVSVAYSLFSVKRSCSATCVLVF